MKKYKHLTAADRKVIEVLLTENYTRSDIASKLKVSRSTICREIINRSTPGGYFADIAQLDYEDKRESCVKPKILDTPSIQNYVIKKLQIGWSPEQISGRLKLKNGPDYTCKETIYVWIYSVGWCLKENLYQYLRHAKKRRTKQNGRSTKKSKIPNRVSIHQRSTIVNDRTEFGHWEGDSVLYPYKQAINTLNELTSGIVSFTKLDRKTAQLTADAMIKKLAFSNPKTLTLDNGSEFMHHERVSYTTGVSIFFFDPYASYQRGSNENTNMLLRGYLPKRASILNLSQKELDDIAYELNSRPRKRLGYLTPIEFYKLNVLIYEEMEVRVALRLRM